MTGEANRGLHRAILVLLTAVFAAPLLWMVILSLQAENVGQYNSDAPVVGKSTRYRISYKAAVPTANKCICAQPVSLNSVTKQFATQVDGRGLPQSFLYQ